MAQKPLLNDMLGSRAQVMKESKERYHLEIYDFLCRHDEMVRALESMRLDPEQQKRMKERLEIEQANIVNQQKRAKMSVKDFDTVAIVGRGAFGEVRVVRKKDTQDVFAMKIMKKAEMIKKNQEQHIKSERDVLALVDNPYVVKLMFSFQVFCCIFYLFSVG